LLDAGMDGAKMTCNIREFYPEVEEYDKAIS
jgi:hypothetical protein